jgi:hypothetical protein
VYGELSAIVSGAQRDECLHDGATEFNFDELMDRAETWLSCCVAVLTPMGHTKAVAARAQASAAIK